MNVLLQSPITVKEKLDIIYDLNNQTNKFVDGIDIHDVVMIYKLMLKQHLYFIPYNELRSVVERIFNNGYVSGIVGAYWTKKDQSTIKFDMDKSSKSGYCTLEDFLGSMFKSNNDFQTIDVTTQV